MPRPAKAVAVNSKNMTDNEKRQRMALEDQLRGGDDKLIPPLYLTEPQICIFNYIMEELKAANILGNLDLFILAQASIAVDRIQQLDQRANEDPGLVYTNAFRQARAEASKEYFRCCNELCLSPQSRAKLSIAKINPSKKKKTIMDLIDEDDDDG